MTDRLSFRRSLLHESLADAVPSWAASDVSDSGDPVRRSRPGLTDGLVRGQMCFTVAEAFGDDRTDVESVVPAATAVELAGDHVAIHRQASERFHEADDEYDPTRAILHGDVLLSRAFERLGSLDVPHSTRASCLSALTGGCRRTQEARGVLTETTITSGDSAVVSWLEVRLGALVGCAGAIGGLLAGVDDERVDRLERTAARFGSHLGFARIRQSSIEEHLDDVEVGTPETIDRHVEAVVDCLPTAQRDTARSVLETISRTEAPAPSGGVE